MTHTCCRRKTWIITQFNCHLFLCLWVFVISEWISFVLVRKAKQEERERNYQSLLATEDQNLITNTAETDCPICFCPVNPGDGIVLRECLHTFCRSVCFLCYTDCKHVFSDQLFLLSMYPLLLCVSLFRDCLKQTIVTSQDAEVSCPDKCDSKLLDREIQEVRLLHF